MPKEAFVTRQSTIKRKTAETDIEIVLNIDGAGVCEAGTGIGFLDHMLALFCRHGLFDLRLSAKGDLHVDEHHTMEDVGICLGEAFLKALGEKKGITRFGFGACPMDEALCEAALDVSGRPFLHYNISCPEQNVGGLPSQLFEEFFRAFVTKAALSAHLNLRYGSNGHHIFESAFKAVAFALRQAVKIDPRVAGVPSSKGVL